MFPILHDPYNLSCICTFGKAATSFRLYGIPNFKGNLSPMCGDMLNLGSSGTVAKCGGTGFWGT